MNIPIQILVIVPILVLIAMIVSYWFSLKIFGLKLSKLNFVLLVVSQLILSAMAPWLSLLALIASLAAWIWILHSKAENYRLGKAVGSYVVGFILATAVAIIIALGALSFVGQRYHISGNSMAPSLKDGQQVWLDKTQKKPALGEVIIYKAKNGTKALGRVKGLPGQTVQGHKLQANQYYVTVDNQAYRVPPLIIDQSSILGTLDTD